MFGQFRPAPRYLKHFPWIALLCGALLSLAGYLTLRHIEEERLSTEFSRRCQSIASVIELSLRVQIDALHGLRDLFIYSESVTQSEFNSAAQDMIRRYPGIEKLEWVPRVPGTERAAFEAAQRAAGHPDYAFHDWTPGTTQTKPAPTRPEHFPVLYSYPIRQDQAYVFGYDLAGSTALPNLKLSASRHDLVVSERRPLDEGPYSYVMHLPVFAPETTKAPNRLLGYVFAFGRVSEHIDIAGKNNSLTGTELLVVDTLAAPGERIFHFHSEHPSTPPSEEQMRTSPHACIYTLTLGNRQWDLLFRPTPDWFAAHTSWAPFVAFVVGLIASGLLSHGLRNSVRHTESIEQEVQSRTTELRQTKLLLEQDIARRQAAETALRASETRLQAIIDHSPALIFVKDLTGRYVLTNRAYRTTFGLPETRRAGFTDAELFPPEAVQGFLRWDQQVLATREAAIFEEQVTKHTGESLACLTLKFPLCDDTGRPYAICGIATDITERQAAARAHSEFERNLREKQRLESLGVLAGGIAHDFNNLLTAILGNATLIRLGQEPTSPLALQLQPIEQAARRAADLCNQMLAYAGQGSFTLSTVELSGLVRDTAALLEVSVQKGTQLSLTLAPTLPPVEGDATQLRQIVMNLVLNAAEAIGRSGGDIQVTTALVQADRTLLARAVEHPDLPAGDYVSLTVADNGCGIAPETIARIFEPFFSTKFSGRGLGLAAVLGIVRSHRGALFVESTPGQGSTFRLLLPAKPRPQPAQLPAPLAPSTPNSLQGTVLVVDDETAVRLVTITALQRAGLRTLAAEDGRAALTLWHQRGPDIDLILLDLTMPGLNGEETLQQLRTAGCTKPVVLMSGYTEHEPKRHGSDTGLAGFIKKPFDVDSLLAMLRPHLSPR